MYIDVLNFKVQLFLLYGLRELSLVLKLDNAFHS